ncbi:MAG: phosphoglucosamine mutase [Bacillota bacterium]|nr:phosphoglucosamine mutase [Bacillota bacterium]
MGRLFGTDGVRGVANRELTPQLAFRLGRAGAWVLGKNKERPCVLIGKDTRASGDMLEDALSAGVLSMGGDVVKAGVLPTPAVAYLVRHWKADAGAVISASHNPYEYNGIKFFNGEGYKLDDAIEEEIEAIVLGEKEPGEPAEGGGLGRCRDAAEAAAEEYIAYLKETAGVRLDGMKLAADCANGAASLVAPRLFRELGAELTVLSAAPDGVNINRDCGSTHPEALQRAVREQGAALGLAFDGDADRLMAVDETGEIVDGDKMICICAGKLKRDGRLPGNRVTATVMSNLGFHKAVEAMGCTVDVTQVGDRYVLESMRKTGSAIGGEQSGHIIFLEHSTTGDGMLSALQLLAAVKEGGGSLKALADPITIYPQVLKNAAVRNENKKKYAEHPGIVRAMAAMEEAMAGEGRILIRPSGTEPLVRVMLEGSDIHKITGLAEELAALITRELG